MHFDELMRILGEFGKFQKIRFFLVCLFSIVSAWHALNLVFVGAAPDFHCKVSDINLNGSRYEGISASQRKDLFIPDESSCSQYDVDLTSPVVPGNASSSSYTAMLPPQNKSLLSKVECTDGYEFSKDTYDSTIVTEFELVCDKKYWISTSKSVFFCGRLVGALVFGQLSDKYGRRPMFFVGVVTLLLAGSIVSFAPNIYVFLPMYFCQGAAHTGAFLVAYTLSTELVGPKYRVMAGFVSQSFYSLGFMSLAGIAYYVREWRWLEIAITLPVLLFGFHYWYLPESVRWLLSHGKDEQAEKILREAAKVNNVQLGKDIISALKNDPSMKSVVNSNKKYSFLDCVNTWKMFKLSMNLWFNWMVNALVYYGLSLNTENLAGSPYLNFCLAGAVEIPAYAICILILNKVGRRGPLIISMYVGGLACILSGVLPTEGNPTMETLTVILAMVGKFGITASYGIIYLMAAELFPTVIRNIGMGVSSMSARIGGILAPQLLRLQVVYKPLPMLLFGGLAVLGASMAMVLPETAGKPLPQLPEDVDFGSGDSIFCCKKKSKRESHELAEVKA